jgi:hypothetical protein
MGKDCVGRGIFFDMILGGRRGDFCFRLKWQEVGWGWCGLMQMLLGGPRPTLRECRLRGNDGWGGVRNAAKMAALQGWGGYELRWGLGGTWARPSWGDMDVWERDPTGVSGAFLVVGVGIVG